MSRPARAVIAWILIGKAVALILIYRLSNLDMSEGRLFVTYWPIWIVVTVTLFAAAWFYPKGKRND